MDNQQMNKNGFYPEEETIDLRKIFNYFMGNLHWFVISVVVCLTVAFLINRYATRIYSISTTVLIEDDSKNTPWARSAGAGMDMLQGFGMFPSLQNFENQTIILKSYTQVSRTVSELPFYVSYYGKGRVVSREIYAEAPFNIVYNDKHVQPLALQIDISINKQGKFVVSAKGENISLYDYIQHEIVDTKPVIDFKKTVNPGEAIRTEFCDFSIELNDRYDPNLQEQDYFIFFNSLHYLTKFFQNSLVIEPMSKGSSMVTIKMDHPNPKKAIDFLNHMNSVYLQSNLDKKNEFANNTISFIENQLSTISDSLTLAEEALQSFRSQNKVMNLSAQAQQVFEFSQDLENQKAQIEMQVNYYRYLQKIVKENQDVQSILAPSAMGVQDPLLNSLILQVNQLTDEKIKYQSIKEGSTLSLIPQIDARIRSAKNAILENTNNLVQSAEIQMRDVNKRLVTLSKEINKLPDTERKLFGIERKFKLNDELYTFLLQRHAEAQLAKASNSPDNEVIDAAMMMNNGYPIKPKTKINYIIALLLGLIIPGAWIALREYFNMKIDSPDSVKGITKNPIIGYIPNAGEKSESNIFENPDAPWTEAFRIVRTKLQFITKEKQHPVILVTSSIPGEGKSFVSINIASAYALTGKRTVLVGLDLRRPQVAQRFGLDKNNGVTNYLIGESTLEEIVQPTQNPNLDVIASGTIPPNPAELLSDKKINEFIEKLQGIYDFVILDTAPISPVSDTHHLTQMVDANLFVVRDRYTHKNAFEASMEELINNNAQNVCILMNDIQLRSKGYGSKYGYSYGYKYGYKYGYGYGYGYHTEDRGKKKKKKKA